MMLSLLRLIIVLSVLTATLLWTATADRTQIDGLKRDPVFQALLYVPPPLPPNFPTLTIADNINFTLPPALTQAQTVTAIRAEYPTSSEAQRVRNALPRFNGPAFTLQDSTQTEQWVVGTLYYIIPGVVFAAVTLLVWLIVCCSLCCHCCCGKKPSPTNESDSDERRALWIVSISLIVCVSIAVIFTIVGLAYNSTFSNGLTGSGTEATLVATNTSITFTPISSHGTGITTAASNILQDINTFFTTFPILIQQLENAVNQVIPEITGRLTDAAGILTGFTTLATDTSQMLTTATNLVNTYSCNSCGNGLLQPLEDLNNQLTSIALPVLDNVENDIQSIQSSIIDSQSSIDSSLTSAINQFQAAVSTTTSYQSQATNVINNVKKYDRIRFAVTLVIFLLPIIVLIVCMIALIIKSSLMLLGNMHFMFFIMIIMWLVFAVHLPVTSVVSDSCLYMDNVEVTLPNEVDAQTAAVLQACLLNTSLLTAFNFSTSLNFAFTIVIPDVSATDQIFNFTELNWLQTNVNSLGFVAFGYNVSSETIARNAELQQLNALTNPVIFSIANLSSLIVSQFPPNKQQQISSLQTTILTSWNEQNYINNTLVVIQRNMTAMVNMATALQTQGNTVLNSFINIAMIVAPVVNAGQEIIDSAYCGSLGQDYGDAKHSLCWSIQDGVGFMAMASFIIAVMLIPATCLSCVRARQIQATDEWMNQGKEGEGGPMVVLPLSPPSTTPGSLSPGMSTPFGTASPSGGLEAAPMLMGREMTSSTSNIGSPGVPVLPARPPQGLRPLVTPSSYAAVPQTSPPYPSPPADTSYQVRQYQQPQMYSPSTETYPPRPVHQPESYDYGAPSAYPVVYAPANTSDPYAEPTPTGENETHDY